MDETSDLYLMHHGIKGMKWGVRRFEDASGHLTPAGKRRYAIQDARKYYKINRLQRAQEKNRDPDKNERLARRIRRVQTRSDRKHADLTQEDINIGREIVSKNRRNWAMIGTAAKAAATAAGAYALYQNPKTRALAPLAIAGGAALTYGSAKKVPYYTMEARRYKQVNPKGATNRGLTKRQQTLRKIGKVAAGAALAGAAGYALYKTGAADAAINAGRNALESKIGIKSKNKSSRDFDKNVASSKSKQIHEASDKSRMDFDKKVVSGNSKQRREASNKSRGDFDKNVASSKPKQRHEASDNIRKANRALADQRRKEEASRKRKQTIKNTVSNASNNATAKVKDAIRKKVMDGVDEDDPRTWHNLVTNTKGAVSKANRYGRALNNLRKGNKVDAAAEISEDIADATSKIIQGTQDRIDDAKNRRKRHNSRKRKSK